MGGGNTPASGVALYLDRLMKLIKPKTLAKAEGQSVLVKAEPPAAKEGLGIISRLHEAGYRAELYLGAQKPADFDWTIDIKSQAPRFILTDQAKQQKIAAQTMDEVLKILKR